MLISPQFELTRFTLRGLSLSPIAKVLDGVPHTSRNQSKAELTSEVQVRQALAKTLVASSVVCVSGWLLLVPCLSTWDSCFERTPFAMPPLTLRTLAAAMGFRAVAIVAGFARNIQSRDQVMVCTSGQSPRGGLTRSSNPCGLEPRVWGPPALIALGSKVGGLQ